MIMKKIYYFVDRLSFIHKKVFIMILHSKNIWLIAMIGTFSEVAQASSMSHSPFDGDTGFSGPYSVISPLYQVREKVQLLQEKSVRSSEQFRIFAAKLDAVEKRIAALESNSLPLAQQVSIDSLMVAQAFKTELRLSSVESKLGALVATKKHLEIEDWSSHK